MVRWTARLNKFVAAAWLATAIAAMGAHAEDENEMTDEAIEPKKSDQMSPAPQQNRPAPQRSMPTSPEMKKQTKEVSTEMKEEREETYRGYGKVEGIAGPVTFGPSVSLLGFPHPLEVALESKYRDYFGFQGTYGFIPEISIKDVKAKMNAWDVRLRWFPFNGAFYVGAGYGQQTVEGSKTQVILGTSTTASVKVENKFFTPQLGWRWTWESGFFMGLDLGWQFAKDADTSVSSNANALIQAQPQYTTLVNDVKKYGNDYGNKGLPSFTLLHFGFLF